MSSSTVNLDALNKAINDLRAQIERQSNAPTAATPTQPVVPPTPQIPAGVTPINANQAQTIAQAAGAGADIKGLETSLKQALTNIGSDEIEAMFFEMSSTMESFALKNFLSMALTLFTEAFQQEPKPEALAKVETASQALTNYDNAIQANLKQLLNQQLIDKALNTVANQNDQPSLENVLLEIVRNFHGMYNNSQGSDGITSEQVKPFNQQALDPNSDLYQLIINSASKAYAAASLSIDTNQNQTQPSESSVNLLIGYFVLSMYNQAKQAPGFKYRDQVKSAYRPLRETVRQFMDMMGRASEASQKVIASEGPQLMAKLIEMLPQLGQNLEGLSSVAKQFVGEMQQQLNKDIAQNN